MRNKRKSLKSKVLGFTLIELMLVIGIVALLVGLAMPNYKGFVRKANRGEAQQLLLNWSNLQEIWRSNNTLYADDVAAPNGLPLPTHDLYTFSLGAPNPPDATTYVLIATATGDQAYDKSKGVSCTVIQMDQSNAKTPEKCW